MEGQYVAEGATIVKLADLSTVWAEAQVYASQMSNMELKENASVRLNELPGKEWAGKIIFANPEIVSDSRLILLRVELPNPNGLLKPGMPAYVRVKSKTMKTLMLPTDAV